ncbi:hypothetical protein Pla110_22590 [Polystyrenella longa]|uniref:DUF4166 domain-containing protein n=1 Tax=Polystyrenella longa TaxID=2528007 RepID=A0A518CMT3_9PLAN|nr:DUF4166 domain-containing protein [Polystyrenella longa]QDU80528.1 hypothetical protein Pla110_22590 [Polystyrenella longa]
MTSIYQQVLGADFEKLHPKMQERFGFNSVDRIASIGSGVMEEIWRGPFYTLPFLYVGAWRSIMFPECGKNIPFTIENYAYRDQSGRDTLSWIRRFDVGPIRHFDEYMIYSESRKGIVVYLGTHQHLKATLDLYVDDRGGLRMRSGTQRLFWGNLAFSYPMSLSGNADVREWYDDEADKYRVEVEVTNPTWGKLFGYHGSFNVTWKDVSDQKVPEHILPQREERRE